LADGVAVCTFVAEITINLRVREWRHQPACFRDRDGDGAVNIAGRDWWTDCARKVVAECGERRGAVEGEDIPNRGGAIKKYGGAVLVGPDVFNTRVVP
jgi:hypothetical protein